MVDVDVIGAHAREALLDAAARLAGGILRVVERKFFLGRDDDLVARHALERAADDAFGAVDFRGVEEVDAEVEGAADDIRALLFGGAVAHAEAARPAAAEPGDGDLETGSPERDVIHVSSVRFSNDLNFSFCPLSQP